MHGDARGAISGSAIFFGTEVSCRDPGREQRADA